MRDSNPGATTRDRHRRSLPSPGSDRRHPRRWLVVAALTAAIPLVAGAARQKLEVGDDQIGQYLAAPATGAVARAQKALDRGSARLTYDEEHGYLEAALKLLHIPASSQVLVFSKTSLQKDNISPETPRAVYFNDDSYVGWVQGSGALEVADADPQLGAVFYTLPQREEGPRRFVRVAKQCFECHHTALTGHIPGEIVTSVRTLPDGQPDLAAGSHLTTDRSPFAERWGGWYVTGTHGSMRHMGNGAERIGAATGANLTDLRRLFDVRPYLTPHSDVVALMVLAHQTRLHNLIASAAIETRAALSDEELARAETRVPNRGLLEATRKRIRVAVEPLVRAMLFADEAPLTATVRGTSGFAAEFARRGPRDRRGRSLRDFDLKRRLMRYPCSYLIYSTAFDGMPEVARDEAYRGIRQVLLAHPSATSPFSHLSLSDRSAILEILLDTKAAFARWSRSHSKA